MKIELYAFEIIIKSIPDISQLKSTFAERRESTSPRRKVLN